MKTIALILTFFLSFVSSQNSIEVYYNDKASSLTNFELAVIKKALYLYQKKYSLTIDIRYINVPNFRDVFSELEKEKQVDSVAKLAIHSISITDERKQNYDFSAPYLFNKYCLLALETSKIDLNLAKKYSIGFLKKSTQVDILKQYPNRFVHVAFLNDAERLQALENGSIDLIVSGYVYIWAYKYKLIEIVPENTNDRFAVMFPKGSEMLPAFNKIFKYFIKSSAYYKIVRTHFGSDALNYFNKSKF